MEKKPTDDCMLFFFPDFQTCWNLTLSQPKFNYVHLIKGLFFVPEKTHLQIKKGSQWLLHPEGCTIGLHIFPIIPWENGNQFGDLTPQYQHPLVWGIEPTTYQSPGGCSSARPRTWYKSVCCPVEMSFLALEPHFDLKRKTIISPVSETRTRTPVSHTGGSRLNHSANLPWCWTWWMMQWFYIGTSEH